MELGFRTFHINQRFPSLALTHLYAPLLLPNTVQITSPASLIHPVNTHKMSEVTVGSYLFARLKQLGVETVFGVPGGRSYD